MSCLYTILCTLAVPFPVNAAKPSSRHLQFYVVNRVSGPQWKAFCRYLGMSREHFQAAEMNNPHDVNEALMEAIEKWSSSAPSTPLTWNSILTALEMHNMGDYASKLKSVILQGELDPPKNIEI